MKNFQARLNRHALAALALGTLSGSLVFPLAAGAAVTTAATEDGNGYTDTSSWSQLSSLMDGLSESEDVKIAKLASDSNDQLVGELVLTAQMPTECYDQGVRISQATAGAVIGFRVQATAQAKDCMKTFHDRGKTGTAGGHCGSTGASLIDPKNKPSIVIACTDLSKLPESHIKDVDGPSYNGKKPGYLALSASDGKTYTAFFDKGETTSDPLLSVEEFKKHEKSEERTELRRDILGNLGVLDKCKSKPAAQYEAINFLESNWKEVAAYKPNLKLDILKRNVRVNDLSRIIAQIDSETSSDKLDEIREQLKDFESDQLSNEADPDVKAMRSRIVAALNSMAQACTHGDEVSDTSLECYKNALEDAVEACSDGGLHTQDCAAAKVNKTYGAKAEKFRIAAEMGKPINQSEYAQFAWQLNQRAQQACMQSSFSSTRSASGSSGSTCTATLQVLNQMQTDQQSMQMAQQAMMQRFQNGPITQANMTPALAAGLKANGFTNPAQMFGTGFGGGLGGGFGAGNNSFALPSTYALAAPGQVSIPGLNSGMPFGYVPGGTYNSTYSPYPMATTLGNANQPYVRLN